MVNLCSYVLDSDCTGTYLIHSGCTRVVVLADHAFFQVRKG